jgi:hypothetical protein
MTMTVGGLPSLYNSPANNNYDVPTHPKLNTTITPATNKRIYALIRTDGSISGGAFSVAAGTGASSVNDEFTNLENTDGFSIKCYNSFTSTGVNMASVDLTTNDHYVLINSDNPNLHHFAKITSIETSDVLGDKFEFEPKLGNSIAKGTKFLVMQGNPVNSRPIALTGGLLADPANTVTHEDVIVSRPLWYFHNENLKTKNELDHSTKHFAWMEENVGNFTSTTHKTTFLTVDDYRNRIIDKSKYTYVIKTKDNLRIKDDPDVDTSNEGFSWTSDYTTFDGCFYNAKRDSNDNTSAYSFTGPTRYLHYNTSPISSNKISNVSSSSVQESFSGKAGFSKNTCVDNMQILGTKIETGKNLTVKQSVGKGSFTEWIEIAQLGTVISTGATHNYLLEFDSSFSQDITKYLNPNDEVKIGNNICIVSSTPSATELTILDTSRLETEGKFNTNANLGLLSVGEKVYRRALNIRDNTLLTKIPFEETNMGKLSLRFMSFDFKNIEISILPFPATAGSMGNPPSDKDGLLYLDFKDNHRWPTTSGIEYTDGKYFLLYETFTGRVETSERKIENGIPQVIFSGRNEFSKLIDPIVNKETLFSSDIIYSSSSPYNKLSPVLDTGGVAVKIDACDFENSITLSSASTISKNTKLWAKSFNNTYSFIGVTSADSTSSTNVDLYEKALTATNPNGIYKSELYYESNKRTIFNKALSHNNLITSLTSLNGASDKGVAFRDGHTLIGDYNALTPVGGINLAGSSSFDNPLAIGYSLSNVNNIDTDSPFEAIIDSLTVDTINTLIDFEIISVNDNKTDKIVKLAPYVPLTLGRVDINYNNTKDATFVALGTFTNTTQGRSFMVTSPTADIYTLKESDPIYSNGVFIGYVRYVHNRLTSGLAGTMIYLDRYVISTAGATIQTLTASSKKEHDLSLINGAHLHGGKILGLLGPSNTILDYSLYNQNRSKSYSSAFGRGLFKINNLEKGKFGIFGKNINGSLSTNHATKQRTYADSFNFMYYANAYKGKNIPVDKVDIAGGHIQHLPFEQKGMLPITGSNYADRKVFSSFSSTTSALPFARPYLPSILSNSSGRWNNNWQIEDGLRQVDSKASRLFLFANSDLTTYNSIRRDSLMNTNTYSNIEISNLGIMSLKEPASTTNTVKNKDALGGTNSIQFLDKHYTHDSIIESNKDISQLTRFGLMRLTECVYDWAWNPISPEDPIDHSKTLDKIRFRVGDIFSVVDSNGDQIKIASAGITEPSSGNFNVPFKTQSLSSASPNNLSVGDVLVYITANEPTGRVWGTVDALVGSDATLTVICDKINGNFLPADTDIYAIKKSDAHIDRNFELMGHGEDTTSIFDMHFTATDGYGGQKIAMNKWIVASSLQTGFVADKNGSWWDEFAQPLEKAGGGANYIATLCFPVGFYTYDAGYNTKHFGLDYISVNASGTNGDLFITCTTPSDASKVSKGAYVGIGGGGWPPNADNINPNYKHITGTYQTNPNSFPDGVNVVQSVDTGTGRINLNLSVSSDFTAENVEFVTKRTPRNNHPCSVFKWIDKSFMPTDTTNVNSLKNLKGTILGHHDIEVSSDSGKAGTTATLSGLSLELIDNFGQHLGNRSNSQAAVIPLVSTLDNYAFFKGTQRNPSVVNSGDAEQQEGAVLGIKPHLCNISGGITAISTTSSPSGGYKFSAKGSNVTNVYSIAHTGRNQFLEFVDLTGCYLVPISGKYNDEGVHSGSTTSSFGDSSSELNVDDLIYVISHELDTETSIDGSSVTDESSILMLDKELGSYWYKIMQPNQVCTWEKSPTQISINQLSCRYTKQMYSDEMYKLDFPDYDVVKGATGRKRRDSLEGIQSMYVIVDLDNLGGNNNTVLKTNGERNFLSNLNKEMLLSDGENRIITNMNTEHNTTFTKLKFGETKKLMGVVSCSETFELKVGINSDLDSTAKRTLIGSTVDIAKEIEDLVEELLIDNDVSFNLTSQDYPVYASPNFQGTTLYSLARYLLNLKEMRLVNSRGVFTLKNQNDSSFGSRYYFNEDNIITYELLKNEFDFFNEVSVYGSNHKAVKKNIKSIKDIGRKSFESFDKHLTTQSEVDKKAFNLLQIYNNETKGLKIQVNIKDARTLSAGNVVTVEIKQENIERNTYIVLEAEYDISGITTLVLGKYFKNLEDTLANIRENSSQTNSYLRKKDLPSNENYYDFFETMQIKEINLTIRKREQSGATIGFANTFNTNSKVIGFGGTLTHTILQDDDL